MNTHFMLENEQTNGTRFERRFRFTPRNELQGGAREQETDRTARRTLRWATLRVPPPAVARGA